MSVFKKTLIFMLTVLVPMALVLASCGSTTQTVSLSAPAPAVSGMEPPSAGAEIALITTEACLEDTTGQQLQADIGTFAGQAGHTIATYKTEEENPQAAVATLELAVTGGADVVVVLGDTQSAAISEVSGQYHAQSFILVGAPPSAELSSNTVSVQFATEQAGWLLGHFAMYEAAGDLAVAWDGSDTSLQYVLGFLMGAQAAAQEREQSPPARVLDIRVSPDEALPESEILARFEEAYASGVNLIFAACTEMQEYALTASRVAEKKLVSIGTDLAIAGATALASVQMSPTHMVSTLLSEWDKGMFVGGRVVTGTVAQGDIVFEADSSRLENVGTARLNRLHGYFEDTALQTQLENTIFPQGESALATPQELPLEDIIFIPAEGAQADDASN